jgi:hypothetical protein
MGRPPDDEVSRRALAAERLRSSRLLARIRFVGISIACAFNWVTPVLFHDAARYQGSVVLFFVYWCAAAGLYWTGRRSDRVAALVGLDIPFLDMPFAFLIQRTTPAWPNLTAAVLAIAYFALLTIAASFSLVRRRVFLAAATGTVFELVLLWEAGSNAQLTTTLVLVMYGVLVSCCTSSTAPSDSSTASPQSSGSVSASAATSRRRSRPASRASPRRRPPVSSAS